MVFREAHFVKPDEEFDLMRKDYAPLFRRKFTVNSKFKHAVIRVCGLGYAYYYLNGKPISEDLFTAPFSNYEKTLWYNEYDVSNLLIEGDNVLAVCCGNGWYNEGISTVWEFHKADWRDFPKFILELSINDHTILVSDEDWKYTLDSPVIYNQLRDGEYFDARLYDENWKKVEYDDSLWHPVKIDSKAPKGLFRKCTCEPIRECRRIYPTKVHRVDENRAIFDFGVNISGYAELKVSQNDGDIITLRYTEEVNEDFSVNFNGMNRFHFYQEGDFQTDKFICNGKAMVWSPKFTYHGFRYVEVTGLKSISEDTLVAVFVHQAVESRSNFRCSDQRLNTLFEIGQRATLSNLFYMPTDCPTREKMGWMNDAQASADQMLTNFSTEKVLQKWWIDICDAMTPEGMLPGVVPTPGYGYKWGNGPVSDGALFEIPYQIYLHTSNPDLLKAGRPYFDRYLSYLDRHRDNNGDISFGLDDWAAPDASQKVNAIFINRILVIKFLKIRMLAAQLVRESTEEICTRLEKEINVVKRRYLKANGTCAIDKQTSVSMLICYGIYDDITPLKAQLIRLLDEKQYHHDCGMVGMRHLFRALDICNLPDIAYRVLTAEGFPSFMDWINKGATTLYEHWNMMESHNHHMYSDYMVWIIRTILGIKQVTETAGYTKVLLNPQFIKGINFADGYCDTVQGRIHVRWERQSGGVLLDLMIPENIECYYHGERIAGCKLLMIHE